MRGKKKRGRKKRKEGGEKGGEQQIFDLGRKNEKWGSFSKWEEKRKGRKKR